VLQVRPRFLALTWVKKY